MTFADGLIWALRAFGALYLVGGLWMARQMWFWARITPDMDRLTRMLENFDAEMNDRAPAPAPTVPEDRGRPWWLFAGALITAAAGAAMLLAHALAVALLAAVIVHQLLYFVRQRRHELAAPNQQAAAEARPERSAVNGFFVALLLAVFAAWLYHEGALTFWS